MDQTGQIANAISHTIVGTTSWIQVVSLIIILCFSILGIWLWNTTKDNKRVIQANKEAEEAKTAERGFKRDAEFAAINLRIDNVVTDTSKMEGRFNETFTEIKSDIKDLKAAIISIDKTITRVSALFESKYRPWDGAERRHNANRNMD